MLYVLCVEVLACRIRDSPAIEGFLLPGAGGVQLKSASMLTILRPLSKMILPFSHFLTRSRFTSVALVRSLICPRLRPCGLVPGKTALTSHLVSLGLGK